ncbi:bifunctional folylpolyglutamate synthase/dihydrofolate synthase [Heliorestis acidaminivorans]|uniref:tetrahydrofolate synthase n=1 Tax=Heliorestis acidaminivorans TaxID=553427 RepID=A0A6I0F1R5_9FIRM|nr:Mur ligase family protein [Heliorestis acidaminivorans]KAB2952351.1 bifunctional folylpolyglutamate synthase/dihydrofolate synthase [Heliorestis acidaminivorans]
MMTMEEVKLYLQKLSKLGIKPGLKSTTELLRRLGDPHRQSKPEFIHIGGTNGKGSTAVMIASVLEEAGYSVGLFTSPHLHCITERTQINKKAIEEEVVALLLEEMQSPIEAMVEEGFAHPTEFEVWTALSLLYYYRKAVDFVVLEVGMGGAIDATNVVTPLLSVITNVSLDHQDYLGHSVEEITIAKAGIIKKNRPIITASEDPTVLTLLQEKAIKEEAPLIQVVRKGPKLPRAQWVHYDIIKGKKELLVEGLLRSYGPLVAPLTGRHQQTNLATAVAVLEVVQERGYSWTESALKQGLVKTNWPGRQERIGNILLDGAHNEAGAVTLAKTLQEDYQGYKKVMILALLADKEREKVASLLAPEADHIIVCRANHERAGDWLALKEIVSPYCKSIQVIEEVAEALQQAEEVVTTCEKNGFLALIVLSGSLYLVAEARQIIFTKNHKYL